MLDPGARAKSVLLGIVLAAILMTSMLFMGTKSYKRIFSYDFWVLVCPIILSVREV
jgi:hypothetical protein